MSPTLLKVPFSPLIVLPLAPDPLYVVVGINYESLAETLVRAPCHIHYTPQLRREIILHLLD
jgi:hypothetical protein